MIATKVRVSASLWISNSSSEQFMVTHVFNKFIVALTSQKLKKKSVFLNLYVSQSFYKSDLSLLCSCVLSIYYIFKTLPYRNIWHKRKKNTSSDLEEHDRYTLR